jgi:nucleotide-binding universal stress UspA family protein
MPYEPAIRKVLVVLDSEVTSPEGPKASVLLGRATALAKKTGCELELFHACYDNALENDLFASEENLGKLRKQLTDRSATRLAELAAWIGKEGVKVSHEARWDAPRTDAILRKAADSGADVVMKAAREHGYVLGITSHTDWELARRSPAHVWLVNDAIEDIGRIVAAVGNRFAGAEDDSELRDRDLLETAVLFGRAFDAEVHPINAYASPTATAFVGTIGATAVPIETTGEQRALAAKIVERHRAALMALARNLGVPKDNVHLCEGDPADVIPDTASELGADAIVMGASSIGRLERFLTPVTVEPVMSKAGRDIVILREHDTSRVSEAKSKPLKGEPAYDLGQAITYPEDTFESPEEVANLSGISVALRKRILQAWEYDVRAEMAEENEGGPVRDIDVSALDEILAAKELLDMKKGHRNVRSA